MAGPNEIASEVLRWHAEQRAFEPFAARMGIADLSAAYDVQDIVVQRRSDGSGARPVGYKIGLTSPRMQQMCGVKSPLSGVILEKHVYPSGANVALSDFVHLGIEFEVAVRIGRDVEPDNLPADAGAARKFVDAICPAIELVDDRSADYAKGLDALSLAADNSWSAGIVLGEFQNTYPDPGDLAADVFLDGETVDHGNSREAHGHPFAPKIWLAQHLASRGRILRHGDVVMTGSIVRTRFPEAGERYRMMLEGLGSVEGGDRQMGLGLTHPA
jgi:2-keto-4-pentenoate hydratase